MDLKTCVGTREYESFNAEAHRLFIDSVCFQTCCERSIMSAIIRPVDPTEWEIHQTLGILALYVFENSVQTDVQQQLPLWDHCFSLSLLALCLNTNTRPANCCEIQLLINLLILMWSTWLQIQTVFLKEFLLCFKFLSLFYYYIKTQCFPHFKTW